MHRDVAVEVRKQQRISGFAVAVSVMSTLVTLSGSCFLDTKTTLCEASGRRCPPGQVCAANQDACITIDGCGDGIVGVDEVCDDGNVRGGDGCSADCNSDETCGNDTTDLEAGESCDDGNMAADDGCSPSCELEKCGNYVVDVNEKCDSGGVDAENCDADCSFATCGDMHVNAKAGEQCDGGMTLTRDCNSPFSCTMARCGDGFFNPMAQEACDTGGDSQACNGAGEGPAIAYCQIPRCGDFYVNKSFFPSNPLIKEECDSGGVDAMGCDLDCTLPVCGDGHRNMMAMEECDDGNILNDDDCVTGPGGICKRASCGDGYVDRQGPNQELCDTQNNMGCPTGKVCMMCGACVDPPDPPLAPG